MKLTKLFAECLIADYIKVENDGSYFLRKQGDTLYIFLESSNGRLDWKNNLDFFPISLCCRICALPTRPYKEMQACWYAHRGFLRVWKSIEKHIARDILDLRYRKIITVGYSHGAALAVLCHEFIWFQRPDLRKNIEGYGFGCPRVFWGIMTKELSNRWENFTVIRNINDIVTHVPPAWLGFSHVGKMLTVGEKEKYSNVDAHRPENILRELELFTSRQRAASCFL